MAPRGRVADRQVERLRIRDLARMLVLSPDLDDEQAAHKLLASPEQVAAWRKTSTFRREFRETGLQAEQDVRSTIREFVAERGKVYAQELDRLATGAKSERTRLEAIRTAMELGDVMPREQAAAPVPPQILLLNQHITNLVKGGAPAALPGHEPVDVRQLLDPETVEGELVELPDDPDPA